MKNEHKDCIEIEVKITNLDKLDELNEKLTVTAKLLERMRGAPAIISVNFHPRPMMKALAIESESATKKQEEERRRK